jgi:ATP-dependent helicase/DNAse subunit B
MFNPAAPGDLVVEPAPPGTNEENPDPASPTISLFECGDRETELRRIAKEIKELVSRQGYSLNEIALVVRKRAPYERVISRVFEEEGIPCALERARPLAEVPAVRAALKLFELLLESVSDEARLPRMSSIASVIKSEYFEPGAEDLAELLRRYQQNYLSSLLGDGHEARSRTHAAGLGRWNPDAIENVIAYVGSELRIDAWLHRARRLASRLSRGPARRLVDPDMTADAESDSQEVDMTSQTGGVNEQGSRGDAGRGRRLSRELDPIEIGWAALEVEHLSKLISGIPRAGSPRELRDALLRLFERLQFSKHITAIDEAGSSDLVRAGLELRGLEGVRCAMSAAIRAFEVAWPATGDQPLRVGLGAFLEEVIRAIRLPSLRMSVGVADGLRVLEATNVRGLQFRAVFIAGLIEGAFPLRTSNDWLYSQEERERLREYGLALEDISSETLLKEEHYFYQAACRATGRLYLSRPLLLEDESETVAAYYIDELKQALLPVQLLVEEVRRDLDGQDLLRASSRRELAISLVRQVERLRHPSQRNNTLDEAAAGELLRRARQDGLISLLGSSKIDVERQRADATFGRHEGMIVDHALVELIQDIYSASHAFSASELSTYGKCPFQFFANRVLKLEPRGEAALDLSALDAGNLFHKVLNRFFIAHRRQSFASIDGEELAALRNELQRVADEVLDEHEQLVPPLNPQVWQIDREIRKVYLDQLLVHEVGLQRKTADKDVRPIMFELAFGMKSEDADPSSTEGYLIRERTGSGEQISIRGQIDRVDQAADETLIAYDYKSTRGATRADMAEGRDLQLHIYLAALEQLFFPEAEIAGGGYYAIRPREKRRNQGLYREALKAYTGLSDRIDSSLSESDWRTLRAEMEDRIWEFVSAIRSARFEVKPSAPKKTCTWCNYSGMCRFNRLKIPVSEGGGLTGG